MKWIDEETNAGVCRRTAARTPLLQRRHRDRAQTTPPTLKRLLPQLTQAELLISYRMRLDAIDLACRLNDHPMRTFRQHERVTRIQPGNHAQRV